MMYAGLASMLVSDMQKPQNWLTDKIIQCIIDYIVQHVYAVCEYRTPGIPCPHSWLRVVNSIFAIISTLVACHHVKI